MTIITGVKFRSPGKVYYFDPGDMELKYNDNVIVETSRGMEYGRVVLPKREVPDEDVVQPLKPVIRLATPQDDEREAANREKEEKAFKTCQEKIREHELDMKLVGAEYTFDNNKLLFYFTADGRVDFRELVKDLASVFRTRIELRQIGVRDETRILGGMGMCGRPLCCHTYLHDFVPVSIKMAKEQNLSLNPTKISGTCGRLMCCLKNEFETYEYLNKDLPRKGDSTTTPDGFHAEVQSVNILRQTVKIIVDLDNDEKEMRDYPVSELTFIPKKGRRKKEEENEFREVDASPEELKKLMDSDEEISSDETNHEDGEKKPRRRRRRHKKHPKNTDAE